MAVGGPQAETGSTVTTGFHRTEGGTLEGAAGEDIFFIPQVHFATETPALVDDEGWWY